MKRRWAWVGRWGAGRAALATDRDGAARMDREVQRCRLADRALARISFCIWLTVPSALKPWSVAGSVHERWCIYGWGYKLSSSAPYVPE